MTDPRPSWREYFLGLATSVATRADCTRRQVGAVLTHKTRVINTGYNGVDPGQPGCLTARACPRGQASHEEIAPYSSYSNCIATHAEENALRGVARLDKAVLYVTDEPCSQCWDYIEKSDLGYVVWPEGEWARTGSAHWLSA